MKKDYIKVLLISLAIIFITTTSYYVGKYDKSKVSTKILMELPIKK